MERLPITGLDTYYLVGEREVATDIYMILIGISSHTISYHTIPCRGYCYYMGVSGR